jgi:hypothetical protein
MKKLLVLALVLSVTTMASAALHIAGAPTGILQPSDTVQLSITTDSPISAGVGESGGWGLVASVADATISGGVSAFPNEPGISIMDDIVGNFGLPVPDGTNGVGGMILITGVISGVPIGSVFTGINFHCEAPTGDVTVYLVSTDDYVTYNVLDSVVIHQVPEPFTMGLLGLGGLFLRRRK